jgi:hypothetical protein
MRYRLFRICVVGLALVLTGCSVDQQRNAAVAQLEFTWKAENDKTFAKNGHRVFPVPKRQAFAAAQATARKFGMIVERQDYATGFLFVTAPGPLPLSQKEWREVQKQDTGKLRDIVRPHMGLILTSLASLDAADNDVLTNIFITSTKSGSKVAVGIGLRERSSATGLIPRTQAPPTAVRLGLAKFWKIFSEELKTASVNIETEHKIAPLKKPVAPSNRFSGIEFGRYYALIIGNNGYEKFPDLKLAAADAKAVARVLLEDYGFENTLMINATRLEVIDALADFRRELKFGDSLLIYYAGHGLIDDITKEGYWLPVDAKPTSPGNWISTNEISTMVRAIRAKHVMVIADSCYSGTLLRAAPAQLKTAQRRISWIKRMLGKRARTALTSGGLEPVLDSGGGDHSVFTGAVIAALHENSEVLEGQRLFDNIKRLVVLNSDQTPQYSDIRRAGHDGGDFLFIRK